MIEHINMELKTSSPNLIAVLEDRGFRATFTRKAIASVLEEKHEGFTVEALTEELPSVSRATVYRTIKLLLEAGVVCKLTTMDGSHLYSVSRVGHHHHHYVCVKCGAVEEFRATAIERLLRSIGADLPGEIIAHRIELYVVCNRCPVGEEA